MRQKFKSSLSLLILIIAISVFVIIVDAGLYIILKDVLSNERSAVENKILLSFPSLLIVFILSKVFKGNTTKAEDLHLGNIVTREMLKDYDGKCVAGSQLISLCLYHKELMPSVEIDSIKVNGEYLTTLRTNANGQIEKVEVTQKCD